MSTEEFRVWSCGRMCEGRSGGVLNDGNIKEKSQAIEIQLLGIFWKCPK
jgi:hypothetical protein